jgi:FkbM family methyltransferase
MGLRWHIMTLKLKANTMEILKTLNKNFVVFDLGSSFAKESKVLKQFSNQITYLEIDAVSISEIKNNNLYKNIKIQKGIHTSAGTKDFYLRSYIETSSFLKIKPEQIKAYGMEKIVEIKEIIPIECTTINSILEEHNLSSIDFLKTDIEGLDFEIIKSIEDKLSRINVIKSEIRFNPFYESEKPFYEICQYLANHGFEFINFTVLDEWKYNTKNQSKHRDGRLAWGDFVFFRKLNTKDINFISDLTKQILIAKSLNLNSYSEFLLENNKESLSKELYNELEDLVLNFNIFEQIFNSIFKLISKTKLIHPIRKTLKYIYQRSRINDYLAQSL